MSGPQSSPESPGDRCPRSDFLERLLADEEHGRLAAVDEYERSYPSIADFVRSEYSALFGAGQRPTAATAADPPARLGRYELRGRLGEGGMGVVREAYDPKLGRRVVVKSLRAELAASAPARERLRREARVLGQLADPRLARVLDLLEDGGELHLVMPFHDGRTLAEVIGAARERSDGGAPRQRWIRLGPEPCGEPEALRRLVAFFVGVAEALDAAHRAGIVHRDLKPQNLMVAPDGAPVVLDFGLALPAGDPHITVPGELIGTPFYMAPEQVEGGAIDVRTDVYALGVVLCEALTLVHPFAGGGGRAGAFVRILRGDPVRPRRHRPMIPRDLEAVVLRAMEPAPDRRYASMGEMARDLQRVLDLEPTQARPVSGAGLLWRRVRRRPWTIAAWVLVLVLAGAAWRASSRAEQLGQLLDQMLELPLEQIASKEAVAQIRERRELLRTIDTRRDGLFQVLPRGKVAQVSRLVWSGLPLRDEDPEWQGVTFHYEYDVVLRDGETLVANWRVPQGESLMCSVDPPTDLAAGRPYTWSVSLAACSARRDDGTLVEGIDVEQVRASVPGVEVLFTIVPLPGDAPRIDAPLDVQVRWLLDRHYACDALLLLDRDPRVGTITPRQHAELVSKAAARIGDEALRRVAQQALDKVGSR